MDCRLSAAVSGMATDITLQSTAILLPRICQNLCEALHSTPIIVAFREGLHDAIDT